MLDALVSEKRSECWGWWDPELRRGTRKRVGLCAQKDMESRQEVHGHDFHFHNFEELNGKDETQQTLASGPSQGLLEPNGPCSPDQRTKPEVETKLKIGRGRAGLAWLQAVPPVNPKNHEGG